MLTGLPFKISSKNESKVHSTKPSRDDSNAKATSAPTERSTLKQRLLRRHRVKPLKGETHRECLKEQDPFLYFSLSKKRLDRLRFDLDYSSDDDSDFNDKAERKGRVSTEVHHLHWGILGSLFEELDREET